MFQETTTPLLRPRQTEELKEEAKRLREILSAPPHVANRVEDRGQLTKNLRAAERDLSTQAPTPYREEEIDEAKKRADTLKAEMLVGMPTQEEMRRNPPGAVDKHRLWEKRNKSKLSEWKNIELRLHQNGFGELPDATDLVNFERYRPSGGSQQLNMDNAQIPGALQFGPKPGAGPATVLTDQETDTLRAMDPELADRLALMPNDQRARVKEFIRNLAEPGNVQPTNYGKDEDVSMDLSHMTAGLKPVSLRKRKGRQWTPEERKAFGEKMKAAREAKKQEG